MREKRLEADLRLLAIQLDLGLVHAPLRGRPHARTLVKHPVDRRQADAGLQRELLHSDCMGHGTFVRRPPTIAF
jgi:hypothetical protein